MHDHMDMVGHHYPGVHLFGIPVEQFLLFPPSQGAVVGSRLFHGGLPFALEGEQNFSRQRARQPERDKVAGAFALEVRQSAARVNARDKSRWLFRQQPWVRSPT
jgi:hypothetical protein